jgi:hypothetical protein
MSNISVAEVAGKVSFVFGTYLISELVKMKTIQNSAFLLYSYLAID